MIPELGHFSLIIAFCLSLIQIFYPLYSKSIFASSRFLAYGQCSFITISILCLLYPLVVNDFSVVYVAEHSNSRLPLLYRITALWSAHEGSALLWIWILSIWMLLVAYRSYFLPTAFVNRVLQILSGINSTALLFLLALSNPFLRQFMPIPLEGKDLNPLLQDSALAIHPPILYAGYVGFAVPFAVAISALLEKPFALFWVRWLRSYVLAAWAFLTIGITLGSWWAYYELGWGGWWFWDPVENASFMPWLLGIALFHMLLLVDKKPHFVGWTILLCILCFSLSLFGTFLVRSGSIVSVHAFALDPKRGLYILGYFIAVVGAALLLYGLYVPKNRLEPVRLGSRESLILIGSIFFFVAVFTILLGTLFPLLYESVTHQQISVGFPYFNAVFIPLMVPVFFLMVLAPFMSWDSSNHKTCSIVWRQGLISVLVAFLFLLLYGKPLSWSIILGVSIGCWVCGGTLLWGWKKVRSAHYLKRSHWAMLLAHFGIGVTILGVVLVSHYAIEKDVVMHVGDTVVLDKYQIHFVAAPLVTGDNYVGHQGHFVATGSKKSVALYPEKRMFIAQEITCSETAISPGFFSDLYIALGEHLEEKKWSVRLYYKPFVRWIWMGGILMSMGAFLAVDKKRRAV